MVYNNLSGYFRQKYGKRIGKICIDGGFTCPNRDGKCGTGGCIFCGERGAGEHIDAGKSIRDQVKNELSTAKDDDIFVAYFQNFTNTYAPIKTLKERYDAALIDNRIKALAIGTRPDCIDEEICRLINEYKTRLDVWVELGFQTANDETAKIINRGYGKACFEKAMQLLDKYNIPVCVHMIIGLPGEDIDDIKNSTEYLSSFNLWGIKIHSLYVMRGTVLDKMYQSGKYTPMTLDEYVESAVYMLTHISPDTIVHRLTGDAPRDTLTAPEWNRDKHRIIGEIVKKMESQNLYQGCLYNKTE